MNRKTSRAIEQLEESGCSACLSLADHLQTVADNGGSSQTTAAMHEEALAMIDAAESFLNQAGWKRPRLTLLDAIDSLHPLRGLREGVASHPDRVATLDGTMRFVRAAGDRGAEAEALALILQDLERGNDVRLWDALRLNNNHRAALARVLSAYITQGGF